jgi:hypothetical protein
MFLAIVQHAPLWAWALLAGLVALGLWQTLPRQMTLQRATLLPSAMAILSLASLAASFGWTSGVILAWVAGAAKSLLTMRATGGWRGIAWSASAQRLLVPGSWLPLALLVGLFAAKFAVGTMLAMHLPLSTQPAFASVVALVYGAFSGLFLSRGLAMWRVARAATPA